MAKRSDFAQKLLDDLRVRKERLAASQHSSRSHSKARDAHGYSKQQTFRGSTEYTKTTVRPMSSQSRGGQNSLARGEASSQIVPYGKSQSSQQIGDFSMALAFALQNGGNLRRVDSSGNNPVLTFLHQIGGGSADFRKGGRGSLQRNQLSTSRVPSLTHLHIKEISKGAQKLNQILRACSNGLNFDQYSIEIGKELLKGAMDLQESLRMLVNLQEASEDMVTPQRKSRIVLLEDDDDNDDAAKSVEQKQLDLPRFSFDKSRRHPHNIHDNKQWFPALVYPADGNGLRYPDRVAGNLSSTSDRRLTNSGNDVKQSNISSTAQRKSEKGRISNVIAKLMGLEEVPGDKNSKQTKDGKGLPKSEKVSNRDVETKSRDAVTLVVPSIKGNGTKPIKNLVTPNTIKLVLTAEENVSLDRARSDMVEKPPWSNGNKMDQRYISHLSQQVENQRHQPEKERKHDSRMLSKPKSRGIKENHGPIPREEQHHVAPKPRNRSEARLALPEKAYFKERNISAGKRIQEKLYSSNHVEPQRKLEPEESYVLRRVNTLEERKQQIQRQKKGSASFFEVLAKPRHEVVNTQTKHSYMIQSKVKKHTEAEVVRVKLKEQNGAESPQRINGLKKTHGQVKEVINSPPRRSTCEEVKQVKQDKSTGSGGEKREARISKNRIASTAKSMETEPSIVLQQNVVEELPKGDRLDTPAYKVHMDDYQDVDETQTRGSEDVGQSICSPVIDNPRIQAIAFGQENEPQSARKMPTRTFVAKLPSHGQLENGETAVSEIQDSLTECEISLKCILMRSKLFLDTAEALFKFNIPAGVFNACSQDSYEDDSKLVLDCGYEIMKRKGWQQELTVHPFMTVHFCLMKVPTFDYLVKQLSKSFERLKLYGRNGSPVCDIEDYLPRMLECDIHVRDPEINPMWDVGWNDQMFALLEKDEVIKDLEKQVLAGLIEETARDLLHM